MNEGLEFKYTNSLLKKPLMQKTFFKAQFRLHRCRWLHHSQAWKQIRVHVWFRTSSGRVGFFLKFPIPNIAL